MITDLILRGMVLGAIVLTALMLLSARRRSGVWSIVALGVCVACYLLISAPAGMPAILQPPLTWGAILAPLALTWMATQHLTDDPPQRRPLMVLALLTVLTAALAPVWPVFGLLRGGLAIVLYLGLIWLAVITDQDDLVAKRRRFRRGFLAAMGGLGLIVSVIEASGMDADLPGWVYPLQATAILALVLLLGLWALSPDTVQQPKTARKTKSDLAERIEQAMIEGIWQREGLTIGAFASELGVPEHQLRAAINGEMGHRNFSTYINSARIKAAQRMLDNPAQARVTILEIAHEVGFASLGPFNKAFRAQTGTSPRDYRRQT